MSMTEKQPSNGVTDPDALAKLLEMELTLKSTGWEQSRSRRNIWRALSFLFLLLVIVGGLVAWFYFAPALSHRDETSSAPVATDSAR